MLSIPIERFTLDNGVGGWRYPYLIPTPRWAPFQQPREDPQALRPILVEADRMREGQRHQLLAWHDP